MAPEASNSSLPAPAVLMSTQLWLLWRDAEGPSRKPGGSLFLLCPMPRCDRHLCVPPDGLRACLPLHQGGRRDRSARPVSYTQGQAGGPPASREAGGRCAASDGHEASRRGSRTGGGRGRGDWGHLPRRPHPHQPPDFSLSSATSLPRATWVFGFIKSGHRTHLPCPGAAGEKPPDVLAVELWPLGVPFKPSSPPRAAWPTLGVTSHLPQQDTFSESRSVGTPGLPSPAFPAPPPQLLSQALCPSPSPEPSTTFLWPFSEILKPAKLCQPPWPHSHLATP